MEIKTTRASRETDNPNAGDAPDKNMYLRRKATQKIRKSYPAGRMAVRSLKLLGMGLVLVAAIGFVATVFIYAFTSDHFTLRTVSIQGCRHVDPSTLDNIVRTEFPLQILRIDLGKVRQRLEQEAWIRRAELRRVLPSELVLYVEERKPAVVLEIRGKLALLDENGVLLDSYLPRYGKLDMPVFRGALGENPERYRLYQEENSERVRLGLRMLSELEEGSSAFPRGISEVDISDRGNLKVILIDDTAEIHLGDRDFLKRFRTLMDNMDKYRELKEQYEEIVSVDLRFDNRIIFRPRKAPEVPANLPVRTQAEKPPAAKPAEGTDS